MHACVGVVVLSVVSMIIRLGGPPAPSPERVEVRYPLTQRQQELAAIEADVRELQALVEKMRAEPDPDLKRPLLPSNAWPLTLGREQARRIVDDLVEGRGATTVSADDLVYYGGGVAGRLKDVFNTSITINWKMIQKELADADDAERRLAEARKLSEHIARVLKRVQAN